MRHFAVTVFVVIVTVLISTSTVRAEESGCYQTADNWIIRVYSGGGANPYTMSLHVMDTNGDTVDAGSIVALSALGNPYVFETGANRPDVSLACDGQAGNAYILHDHQGALVLTTFQGIVSVPTGTPVLSVNTNLVAFGTSAVNVPKDSSVTVTNTGTAALHVTSVTAPAAPFSITSNPCNGSTLAPAGTCTISIRFLPTATGTFTRTFTIASDGGSATITLQGTGGKAR